MTEQVATYERGRWSVPVGSVVDEKTVPCDNCGNDILTLVVRTPMGHSTIENDWHDYVDAESLDPQDHVFMCGNCRCILGWDEE